MYNLVYSNKQMDAMYIDKTPEPGDLIQVVEPECRAGRKQAGMICSGLVTSVDPIDSGLFVHFRSHGQRSGVVAQAVRVLDRNQFFNIAPPQADFADSEQAGL